MRPNRLSQESPPAAEAFEPAKRRFGQNFLVDQNIARKIVASLDIRPDDRVLEIGPGPGALTRFILEQGPSRFIAVERDLHWALTLKRARSEAIAVCADALTLPWERFDASRPVKIIGNLPYNGASPLRWQVFSRARGLVRAVFMVQKEVAERLAARPGSRVYGALSAWVQSFVEPKLLFHVGPQVFRPRPKVDSSVLRFEPIPAPSVDTNALASLIKRCFQQRRKQLRSILRDQWSDDVSRALEARGLGASSRPEELSPAVFQELTVLL